jgi:hypothetical protein
MDDVMANIEREKAVARVLYMIDGVDFDLIVRERADGPTATLVARRIIKALDQYDRGAVEALERIAAIEVEPVMLVTPQNGRLANAVGIAANALAALRGR